MKRIIQIFYIIFLLTGSSLLSQKVDQSLIAKIKYISAENIYLDSGTAAGILAGDRFTVFHNDEPIARIEVVFVANYSASCKVLSKNKDMVKGDSAVRTFKATSSKKTKPANEEINLDDLVPKKEKKSRRSFARVSGSISFQWYQFQDLEQSNLNFSQPLFRLNFRVRQLWNQNYNFRIKMRSHYNNRTRNLNSNSPKSDWINRIYILSFEYNDKSAPVNFKLGRVISEKFSGIGYIDGVIFQHNTTANLNIGIFAGAQPEWHYSDFQTSLQKYGLYFNYQQGEYQSRRFESTLAVAGEYHSGTVSREFIYLQNRMSQGSEWQIFQSMALDINRDWRKEMVGESVSLSNLYIYGKYKFSDWFTAGLSYDNRKNYLTYETKSLAEELFDSVLRQGLRTNLYFNLPQKYRISANFGLRKRDNESEMTYSYNTTLSKTVSWLNRMRINVGFSGFSNKFTQGINPSVRMTQYLPQGHSIEIAGGSYIYNLKTRDEKRLNNWTGIDGYFDVFHRFYLITNYEYNWGDDAHGHRVLAEIGYRF